MLRAIPPALDPPCEEDIKLAAQGDMLARGRVAKQKWRYRKRQREREAWIEERRAALAAAAAVTNASAPSSASSTTSSRSSSPTRHLPDRARQIEYVLVHLFFRLVLVLASS